MTIPKIKPFDQNAPYYYPCEVEEKAINFPYSVKEKVCKKTGTKYNTLLFKGEELPCREIIVHDKVGESRSVTITVNIL